MLRKIYYFILNWLLTLSYLDKYMLFMISTLNVQRAQQRLLIRILKRNKGTIYGRKYDFSSISNAKDFQIRVPITDYDNYKSHINSIMKGKGNLLTHEKVLAFEPTSGSSDSSKYIPYTKTLKKEFQRGIGPWIFDLFMRYKISFGKAYWSITPNIKKQKTKSKIPIGFDEDTEYFGSIQKFLINNLLAVPKEVNKIRDIESFRYITLLFLLKNKNLAFISIWNPTYASFLFSSPKEWFNDLVKDLEYGKITGHIRLDYKTRINLQRKLGKNQSRAKELKDIFNKWESSGHSISMLYENIWPSLNLISCWTSGNSNNYSSEIRKYFPNIEIQGKGLIATEGFVSFPFCGLKAPILSINSHFFEFADLEDGSVKLAHELLLDRDYSVIITTGGGLYRYKLYDKIKVKGFQKNVPLIEFLGKQDNITDLFGEKISEGHVEKIFRQLFRKYSISPNFFMLAPTKFNGKDVSYVCYVQFNKVTTKSQLKQFTSAFELELRKNYHYDYCRKLDQLKELKLFSINSDGLQTYLKIMNLKGQKLGNIKPNILNKYLEWHKKFNGELYDL